MNAQQFSFDDLPGFQRHSDTSRQAAINFMPKVGTKRRAVLDCIERQMYAGATDEELQRWLNMTGNTERPRRVELLNAGFIKDSGMTRPTLSGEQAVVWVLKRYYRASESAAIVSAPRPPSGMLAERNAERGEVPMRDG